MGDREQILGVRFRTCNAGQAVAEIITGSGGCVVIPAAPALTKLRYDETYRSALQQANLVLLDSELVVALWRIVRGRSFPKCSGIAYLRELVGRPKFRRSPTLWIVSSERSRESATRFLAAAGIDSDAADFWLRPSNATPERDHALLLEVEARKPEDIVVATRGSGQEQLGIYLRDYLMYRPRIHCVGAALGFLSGDEPPIPRSLERLHLGWLARLISQPGLILPRLGIALTLAAMIFRYGAELPALQTR